MSVRAYLPSDYSSATEQAMYELRSVILNRQAQQIVIAKDAADKHDDDKFFAAMATVAVYNVVLNDIRVAIQREQTR